MDKIILIIQIRFLKITHSFLFYLFTFDLRSSLLSLDNDQTSLSLFSLTRSLYMHSMHEVVPSAVSAAVMMLAST